MARGCHRKAHHSDLVWAESGTWVWRACRLHNAKGRRWLPAAFWRRNEPRHLEDLLLVVLEARAYRLSCSTNSEATIDSQAVVTLCRLSIPWPWRSNRSVSALAGCLSSPALTGMTKN